MKTRTRQSRRFQLRTLAYETYYIERIAQLERALARKPRVLQLEMIGAGEIQADPALLMRSVLLARSPKTRLVTSARSTLRGGAVLIWLLGDTRLIRDDARLFFRKTTLSEDDEEELKNVWKAKEPKYCDSFSELDPDEVDYRRVLELINEFLPVKELAGRPIDVSILKQFGLVDNEKVDHFLATAFGRETSKPPEEDSPRVQEKVATVNSGASSVDNSNPTK